MRSEKRGTDEHSVTRRSFIKHGAGFAATFAVAQGLYACAPSERTGSQTETQATEDDGEWVPLPCNTGCCNNCVNYGYLVDGKIVRQRTDDSTPDSFDKPQVRSCVKGHSLRYKYQGEDRLNYPMKRKSWQPGGGENAHGELRGTDEWERITWDEATSLIADELARIKKAYGNKAFLAPGTVDERSGVGAGYLLYAYGGCVNCWGSSSAGTWPLACNMMQGQYNLDNNDKYSLLESKLIVLWGYNPVWTWPKVSFELSEARKAGARIVIVDPWFSPSAQALADEWVPVRPGTDGALLLAIACHMIENNLQDQEFLDKYTVGFDAEHMPADAKTDENFKGYVLGEYDGIKKDAAWAAPICGVPAKKIVQFAEEFATVKPAAIRASMAPARTDNGFSLSQLFMAVGWMTGNKGSAGAEVAAGAYVFGGYGSFGASGLAVPANTLTTLPLSGTLLWMNAYDESQDYGVAYTNAWDAVLTGRYNALTHGERDIDIKCIYNIGYGAPLNNLPNTAKGIKAYQKVDFVVSSDIFMNTDCCYSDIVLPAASPWDRPWGGTMRMTTMTNDADGDSFFVAARQVLDSPNERKTDLEMEVEIGKKLGIPEETLQNLSWDQLNFNKLATATVMNEAGEMVPMFTISQEKIDELGVDGTPQEGMGAFDELMELGQYKIERSDGTYRHIGHEAFIADPTANPLPTASGKLEICCQTLADSLQIYGTGQISPIPKYLPADHGYEATFSDWDSQEKGEYDLQFLTVHYIAHQLSQMSNVRELNEYWPNNLLVSTIDATARGLETGDTALIQSEYGKMLRRVTVVPTLMPGTTILGTGNWVDLNEDGVDLGGCGNSLCGDRTVGFGQVPWNSTLVKLEKYDGEALEPDYLRPRRIMEA